MLRSKLARLALCPPSGLWRRRTLVPALLAPALLGACVSVAPPVRTGHYGAPARVQGGMVEVAGEMTWGPDLAGGPLVGYGITDGVSVEGGAELGHSGRAMGWAGARLTPLRPDGRSFAFVLDVEGGAGAGVGGQRCIATVCYGDRDIRRAAGGGYLGFGVGGKIKWFYPWARLRMQVSAAEGIPPTSLNTAVAGVQFSINEFAHIYLGTGVFLLANEDIVLFNSLRFDGGLSFTIPTPRTRRLQERRERRERGFQTAGG